MKKEVKEFMKEMLRDLIDEVEEKDVFIRKSCLLEFFEDYLDDDDGASAFLSPDTSCWRTIEEIKNGDLCGVTKKGLNEEIAKCVAEGNYSFGERKEAKNEPN